jgi:flagellar hook-associated protein 3 FlgL
MRISSAMQYSTYDADINSAQNKLYTAQQQESTGLAINNPSDNPAGAEQVINMNGVESQLNQYQSNLSQAKDILNSTSTALTGAGSIMQSAYQIALSASSGTNSASSEANMAQQITTLQQQLTAAGNTTGPNGEYLFAGQKTSTQPFSASSGSLVYSGDSGSIQIAGGPTDSLTVNVPGSPLFTNAYNQLETLKTDIQSGNVSNISTDLGGLQSAQTAFTDASGTMGSTADSVASLTTANTSRITDLQSDISNLTNVNIANAVTNYTSAQSAYQAALEVVGQASTSLSLVNYISGQ